VSGERRRVAVLVAGLTLALIVILALRPVASERIVAGYVLALAAVGVGAVLRLLASETDPAAASPFELALGRRPTVHTRPPELVRVEREIVLGTTSAGHLHSRLLPLLRDAATARLGTALSREALGDEAWELLRPDRPEPLDRSGPGIPLRRVRDVVTTLERL
jgi:hypothetical protein